MKPTVTLLFVVILAATALSQGTPAQSPVPENATATFGGGWTCNIGFKRLGDECIQMTAQERQAEQAAIAAMRAQERSQAIRLDDYEFTG
jgi:hypothetical protein